MAGENDIVLIYLESSPLTYARIDTITPDAKKDWYHVGLTLLQFPLQTVTWILKNEYINGEQFQMGGKKMKLELIPPAPAFETGKEKAGEENENTEDQSDTAKSNIVSFASFKNKTSPQP